MFNTQNDAQKPSPLNEANLIAVIACSEACKQQPIIEKMVYDCIEYSVSVCTVDASKQILE